MFLQGGYNRPLVKNLAIAPVWPAECPTFYISPDRDSKGRLFRESAKPLKCQAARLQLSSGSTIIIPWAQPDCNMEYCTKYTPNQAG